MPCTRCRPLLLVVLRLLLLPLPFTHAFIYTQWLKQALLLRKVCLRAVQCWCCSACHAGPSMQR